MGHEALTPATGWYYVQDRKKVGPVLLAQLQELARSGRLQPSDMVLQDGAKQWVPAHSVNGLFSDAASPVGTPVSGTTPAATATTDESPSLLTRIKEVAEKIKGVVGVLQSAHKGILWAAGALPLVGGLLGDFLRPLAPFNGVLFLLALVASGALLTLFVMKPKSLGYASGSVCVGLLLGTVGFGGWWVLGTAFGSDHRGFMGTHLGPVAHLQATVLTTRSDAGVTTEQPVQGDKLAAEVKKQMETEKDAAKLLQFATDGYPANVIKAEVVGEPKRRKGTGTEIVLDYALRTGVDLPQYETVIGKKLLPILEKIATRKGEFVLQAKASKYQFKHPLHREFFGQGKETFTPLLEITTRDWKEVKYDAKAETIWIVNTSRNQSDDRTIWKWFVVPVALAAERDRKPAVAIHASFKKKNGQELSRDELVLRADQGDCSIPGLGTCHWLTRDGTRGMLISPYLFDRYEEYYTRMIGSVHAMRFTTDEIQQLAKIECSVTSR